MLPKWTEGRCYFTSTDFQKKTLIPWSTHPLPLKSRFWAQKEIVCIDFIWLSTKKGMFGVKMCVHQDQPQLYNLLCFIQQSLRSPSKGRTRMPGGAGGRPFFTDTGRWWLIRKWSNPQGNTKRTENPKNSKTTPERDGFFTWVAHRQKFQIRMGRGGGRATVNNHIL